MTLFQEKPGFLFTFKLKNTIIFTWKLINNNIITIILYGCLKIILLHSILLLD